ncbi:MAG: GyrI-like domain-containing protein [Legionellales bacterium]|nr:GyrI-like domain-containing protein [Legionellales bacterium]
MKKIDYKKKDKTVYQAKIGKIIEVNVPTFNFLQLDGRGDPNLSNLFSNACEALFSVSYKIKFAIKKGDIGIDYSVMPLEGLWWVDDGVFNLNDKSNWLWTLMIRQPEFITQKHLDIAINEVQKHKGLAGLSNLSLGKYNEGLSFQILHLGPYCKEQETIDTLHDYIDRYDFTCNGKHHEIYLNNPTKTAPDKLKTIIRQPIIKKS